MRKAREWWRGGECGGGTWSGGIGRGPGKKAEVGGGGGGTPHWGPQKGPPNTGGGRGGGLPTRPG